MKPRTTLIASITFLLLAVVIMAIPVGAQTVPEENQVEFWCGDDGVKFEPVDTPFIVPAPPEGTVWTLIVLKGGTTNETHEFPVEGDAFSHSEHGNSHVILCYAEGQSTTTSSSSTTSSTSSTTTSSTTSTSTTTTVPETTTSSSTTEPPVTTTLPTTTTTESSSSTTTTSTLATTTTTDPSTTTTDPGTTTTVTTTTGTLPNTGAGSAIPFGFVGIGLLLLGLLLLLGAAAYGYGRDGR